MKRGWKICIIVVLALILLRTPLLWLTSHTFNVIASAPLAFEIKAIEGIEVVEVKTEHRHFVGNGNGIEYRCCALIKGDASEVEGKLAQHMAVVLPEGASFPFYHTFVRFEDKEFNQANGEGYYMIYIYDCDVPSFGRLDICGH